MQVRNVLYSITKSLKSHYRANTTKLALLDFIKIEALLYLFTRVTKYKDANKAYLLLSGLDRIDNKHIHNEYAYILFCARIHLKKLRSQKNWEDLLAKYKNILPEIRLFEFDDNGDIRLKVSNNIPYPKRKEDYWNYLQCIPTLKNHDVIFANEGEIYKYNINGQSETIRFPSNVLAGAEHNGVRPSKKGGVIEVSLADLFESAMRMDELLAKAQFKDERMNWYESIKKVVIKQVKDNQLIDSENVIINKLCHTVGMVGAGKSTFMKVLAFWAVKSGYRIVIVLDSVAEVMKAVRFFERLELDVLPLLGRSPLSRSNQLEKVVDNEAMFLEETYSQYLTGVCPLDGLRHNTEDKALEYGTEPCNSLEDQDGKMFSCPFYHSCPAQKSERKLISADIVITTPAGFIYGKTPFPLTGQKQHFVEYVVQAFDLVVFDEADMIQAAFDTAFCPTLSVDELIAANGEMTKQYMEAKGKRLELDEEERRFRSELPRLLDVCDAVKELIKSYNSINKWGRIGQGNSFSAQVLLNQMENEVISGPSVITEIAQELQRCIDDSPNGKLAYIFTKIKADSYDNEIDELLKEWLDSLPSDTTQRIEREWFIRIKFIAYLIVLEQKLRYISDYGVAIGTEEMFSGALRNKFQKLQDYLPASAVGNIFGFVYDREKQTVKIFRQFAFGRALMLSLPYFKPNVDGTFGGPNVLLLSGTSWAKGATKYHVSAEVNYILENDYKIRKFIEETEVFSIKGAKVSGSGDKRPERLKQVIKDCMPYIEKELIEKSDGRILFVVNNYPEASQAKAFIASMYPGQKVLSMTKDDANEMDGIRRGDINLFFTTEARMLVAPAGSIERGHNIVDARGHSVFTSVFFLARPMNVPGDIDEAVTKINGRISAWSSSFHNVDSFEYIRKLRAKAVKEWFKILGGSTWAGSLKADEDLVVSRLVIIHQIFGRLLRIVDFNRPRPVIYFADGSFEADDPNEFDLLKEILKWLEEELGNGSNSAIVESLYGPFYRVCKRGLEL